MYTYNMANIIDNDMRVKLDSWNNVFTGLNNSSKDKRILAEAQHTILSQNEVEAIYASDRIARKHVEKIPYEACRKWIEFKGDDKLQNSFMDCFKRLKVNDIIYDALVSARLYGGAGVLIVPDGESVENWGEELNLSSITDIAKLIVFNRHELTHYRIDDNILSENFGMPYEYKLVPREASIYKDSIATVHHSRIIRFDGDKLPQNIFISNNYWHDSVLSSFKECTSSYHQAHNSLAYILTDFRQGILRLEGLADMVSNEDQRDALVNRIQMMNLTKSVLNTMLLDTEESYEQNTPTLTNIDKLIDKVDDYLVACSGMPHNVLLGDGARGKLGDTGALETKSFHEDVESYQRDNIQGPIDYIIDILMNAKKGPTGGRVVGADQLSWSFVNLHSQSEEEISKTRKNVADTDKVYIETGVLTPDEVAKSRFQGEDYSMDTYLDNDRSSTEVTQEEQEDIEKENKDVFYDTLVNDADSISQYKLDRLDSIDNATQSIIISKDIVDSIDEAKELASKYGAKHFDFETTRTNYRFEQKNSKRFKALRSVKPPKKGVTIVIGPLKGE